jgi:NAD(P)-dependent dehydrogenase (short-subunit alcohol dehydrogenase family)
MPRYELAGRTIALTGSTGGLGSALAQALRARGANLALLDLDLEAAGAQAAGLGGGPVARAYAADVRDLAALERAMQAAADDFGRLDVAVAVAGVEVMSPMALMDPEQWERTVDINLNGVWRTYRAALPHVAKTRGYLLGISSMAAFVHSPLQAPYTASKAGVWAMSDSIRLEVRHLGVDVGTIHPTFFRTPMMARVLEDAAGRMLWGGHERVPWKMVELDTVVDGVVGAIERRAPMTVIPKANTGIARAAGLFRPLVDRFGWRKDQISRAIDLVARRDDR